MSRRKKRQTRQERISRLGEIFAELGFKNPRGTPPPPEQIQSTPPPKGECGKTLFPTEEKCRQAIKRLRNGKGDTSYLRPFSCAICHGWHMTSVRNYKHP
jgi:hypothetical protein